MSNQYLFYAVTIGLLTGCITPVPSELIPILDLDMGANSQCKAMFIAYPRTCAQDPSCTISYQEVAQTASKAIFAVTRGNDGMVKYCSWSYAGMIYDGERPINQALALCERGRLSYISARNEELSPCEVYARGNSIQN